MLYKGVVEVLLMIKPVLGVSVPYIGDCPFMLTDR